jgi:hypothetical protein
LLPANCELITMASNFPRSKFVPGGKMGDRDREIAARLARLLDTIDLAAESAARQCLQS